MDTSTARVLSGYNDIASYLGVSTKTIQRHLKSIPVTRLENKIMIFESDLADWVQRKTQKNPYLKYWKISKPPLNSL